jgi:hypothetical protein
MSRTDTATARLAALKESLAGQISDAVAREATALAEAARARVPGRGQTPQLAIEPGTSPLEQRVVAEGAAAHALEFGSRQDPAQPFLFSAFAARLQAFHAGLAQMLAEAIRNAGSGP